MEPPNLTQNQLISSLEMSKIISLVLAISVLSFGLATAQDTGSPDDSTAESDTLDCSNKPCTLICPRRTTYRAGTNCTDACDQRICNTAMTCGCYCEDNFRKINGICVRKNSCPKIDGVASTRPGLLGGGLGLGGGAGGGLLGGRRKNIAAFLQKIRDRMEANQAAATREFNSDVDHRDFSELSDQRKTDH